MPDPNLREAVREALELPDEVPLAQPVMNQLTRLDAYVNLKNLTKLSLSHNQTIDVSPLANLTNWEKLWIQNNKSPLNALSLTIFEYDEKGLANSTAYHASARNPILLSARSMLSHLDGDVPG